MSTLLAPNGVASLDRNLGVAIATEIIGGGTIDAHSTLVTAAYGRSLSWDLICFARHVWVFWEDLWWVVDGG